MLIREGHIVGNSGGMWGLCGCIWHIRKTTCSTRNTGCKPQTRNTACTSAMQAHLHIFLLLIFLQSVLQFFLQLRLHIFFAPNVF